MSHPTTLQWSRSQRWVLIVLLCAPFVGCSSSTTHGTVQGTVTLDGQPLREGVVRFVPLNGSSQTASAAIEEGEFTATVPTGLARIECSAPMVTGKQKMYDTADSPEVDIVGELLPERYNVRSELQLEVHAGKQDYALELSSE